ncbi:MAG: DUF3472 domain-containing protein [bacterium]|nr:DUF3472 domain-containing protein [bacterium]
MHRRLLNRRSQRYLVRGNAARPTVAAPGRDIEASATWFFAPSSRSDAFRLFSVPDGVRSLRVERGSVVFAEPVASETALGDWIIQPAGDGSGYKVLESVAVPGLFLAAAALADSSGDFDLIVQSDRDRGAMWLLSEQCVPDARSVHLRYATPDHLSLFYNEVYPDPTPPGTFYCTSGFGADARGRNPSGYAGVQRLPDGEGLAIFSVWHRMADEVRVRPDSLATAVGVHHGADVTSFSGEGSGSSVRLPIAWSARESRRIRFVLTAEALNRDTVITAYVALEEQPWLHLGAIVRAETRGGLMEQPYAFIEDFARSGNSRGVPSRDRSPYQMRSARFANQWCQLPDGVLSPVTESTLTVYSPHPLENVAGARASQAKQGVCIATGGSTADRPPPIGARFRDAATTPPRPPDLSGVPYQ